MAKLGSSEFEGTGVGKSGELSLSNAEEKARYMRRTEEDPETGDINASPDKFEHGGIETVDDLTNSRH